MIKSVLAQKKLPVGDRLLYQENSTFTVYPHFICSLYAFLQEAVKNNPAPAVLETWYTHATRPLLVFLYTEMLLNSSEQLHINEDYRQFKEIVSWMYELWQLFNNRSSPLTKNDLLNKLFCTLAILNKSSILSDTQMRELEQAITKQEQVQPQPIGVQLHHELENAEAYKRLEDPQDRRKQTRVSRQTLLETFLTTPKSMYDIAKETEELSLPGVRYTIVTSLQRAFAALDPETQKHFGGSAETALKAVITDPVKKEESRRKIREGWKAEKHRETGKSHKSRNKGNKGNRTNHAYEHTGGKGKKREFSPSHKQHVTETNKQRWQRYREQKAQQAQATSDVIQAQTEHTVADFTQLPQAQPHRKPQR